MRRFRLPLWGNAALVYAFLYAPILVIAVSSFNSATHAGAWQGFTVRWYQSLWNSPDKFGALQNTLIVAGASTVISTVLGTLLGYGLSRYSSGGRKWASWLILIPVVIPDIVAAVAMLMFFSLLRDLFGIFHLGLATMVVAHITFQAPFVAIIVRARLAGMDPALEEAAHDLGANTLQKFRYVILPLIRPGVFAGAALAFTLSIDDFVISYFTSGPGSTTLPILIYSSVKRGITPDINALSTLMILASVIGTVLVAVMQSRGSTGRGR